MHIVPGVVLVRVKQTAGGDAGGYIEAQPVAYALCAHVLCGHAHPR
jgi:hypothetical protein